MCSLVATAFSVGGESAPALRANLSSRASQDLLARVEPEDLV